MNCSDLPMVLLRSGQEIAIHPLDLSGLLQIGFDSTTNLTVCTSNYQDGSALVGPDPEFDMNLGDVFLRNVYALFDYGTLGIQNNQQVVDDAFIQLLPRTDPQLALSDFTSSRSKQLSNSAPEATEDQIKAVLSGNATAAGTGATTVTGTTPSSSPTSTSASKKSSSTRSVVTAGWWSVMSLVGMVAFFSVVA